jgi:hypothetical protein
VEGIPTTPPFGVNVVSRRVLLTRSIALGNHYESKSQHYLAAPLYLQAVTLSPPNSCHTAVLSKCFVSSICFGVDGFACAVALISRRASGIEEA